MQTVWRCVRATRLQWHVVDAGGADVTPSRTAGLDAPLPASDVQALAPILQRATAAVASERGHTNQYLASLRGTHLATYTAGKLLG